MNHPYPLKIMGSIHSFLRSSRALLVLLMVSLFALEARAAEPAYAREFKGGVALDAERVLAWEQVGDGSGELRLWVFAPGQEPKEVGRLAAEEIRAAAGVDMVVLVAEQKLYTMPADRPAAPMPIELEGEWAGVAYGAKGFVAGGWGDAFAVSKDGRTWTRVEFNAPDEGGLTQFSTEGPFLAALRQTSLMRNGWGINVSEVCVLEEGKPWRRIAHFEGGNNDAPLESLKWFGDRWVGYGLSGFITVTPDGKSERIEPQLDAGEFGSISGETLLFREGKNWLMIHEGWLLESADLVRWEKRAPLSGNDFKGAWIRDEKGAPILVGSQRQDWSKNEVFTLAKLLSTPVAPVVATPIPAAPVAVATQAPSKSPVAAGAKPEKPADAFGELLPFTLDAQGKVVLPEPKVRVASPADLEKTYRAALTAAVKLTPPSKPRGQALVNYYTALMARNLPADDVQALLRERIDQLALLDLRALFEASMLVPQKNMAAFLALLTREQRQAIRQISAAVVSAYTSKTVASDAGFPPGVGWTAREWENINKASAAKNFVEAGQWLRKAADKGDEEAMLVLSDYYRSGTGVTANPIQSVLWLHRAAGRGDAEAMEILAERYDAGSDGAPQDARLASAWRTRANALYAQSIPASGTAVAAANPVSKEPVTAAEFFERGMERYKKYDSVAAVADLQKSAELGEPAAAFNVSLIYEGGVSQEKRDNRDLMTALQWAERAAVMGFEQMGQREPKQPETAELKQARAAWAAGDFVAARKAFEKAAEAGNASALNALGNLYAEGITVMLDEAKAKTYYQKAIGLGSSFGQRRVDRINAGTTVAGTLAGARKSKQAMDSLNATFAGTPKLRERQTRIPVQAEIDALIKKTPWTHADLAKALDGDVNLEALAVALRTDGGDYYEGDKIQLLNRAEFEGLDYYANIKMELDANDTDGGGPWARELAAQAIAARKAQRKPSPLVVDTAELRGRAAAGKLESIYRLSRLAGANGLKLGPLPLEITQQFAGVAARAIRENYAPALWLNASALENASDEAKVDLAQAAIYLRASAEAGEADAAWGLAQAFHATPHYKTKEEGVAKNFFAAEYWFIEAAALAQPGQKIGYQSPEDCLYLLYSFSRPVGGRSFEMNADEPSLRWARELIRRGGPAAEITQLKLENMRKEGKKIDEALAALTPEIPAFPAERVAQLEAAAARGEGDAAMTLAEAYATGRGMLQDDARANEYYRRAAEQGSVVAMNRLEVRYEKGYGVKPDKTQRLAWLRRAADAGDRKALMTLASQLKGAEAIAAFEEAAAAGDPDGWFRIADIYQYGRGGVEKNEASFLEFAQRAANAGSVRAMEALGFFYSYTKKDSPNAILWYRRGMEAGDKESRNRLAPLLEQAGDKAGAAKVYLAMAEDGNVRAQLKTALNLEAGGDFEEGIKWFRKVAATPGSDEQELASIKVRHYEEEQNARPGTVPYFRKRVRSGDNDARVGLALLIVKTDRRQAMDLLHAAATAGHETATTIYFPEFLKQDKDAAAAWLKTQAENGNTQALVFQAMQLAATDKPAGLALMRKAAEAGNADARFRIGMMQYNGNELPQDRAAGLTAIATAADAGFPPAEFALGRALLKGDVELAADPLRGVAYLKKAMAQEYALPVALQAAVLLGQVYETGQVAGVPADLGTAVTAFERATKLDPRNTKLLDHFHEVQRKLSLERKMKGRL